MEGLNMGLNFAQNWPVFILLGLIVSFFTFVIIKGNQQERMDKEAKNKDEVKDKGDKL